jgi:hypothetical protein
MDIRIICLQELCYDITLVSNLVHDFMKRIV